MKHALRALDSATTKALCCALLAALGHMNISKGKEALYVDKQFNHFLKAVMVVIRGSEHRT